MSKLIGREDWMKKTRDDYEKPDLRKIELTASEAMLTPCNASPGGANNCFCWQLMNDN